MTIDRRKVVLYNPDAVFFTMPLALLAIGSELDPEKYDIVLIDGRLEQDPASAVTKELEGAVCLGVTVLTGAPIADALSVSRAAKAAHPDVPIVWGGWHPSMFGEDCLRDDCVDITVQAQGEATFNEILSRLVEGRSMDGCNGCSFKLEDGKVRVNPPRALIPLEAFRPHNYDLIPVERYFDLKGKRQLDYISSQGCNFRCAFCSDPFVYGRKWVGLEPASIVRALEKLWTKHRFDDVNFQDETFFTKRERVESMARSIVDAEMEFTWAATMRADQGMRLPDEVWKLCKQSGLRRLLVGVESGDPAMLKRIKKDVTIEKILHTAERMRELDIAGIFPFIVGFPDESDASVDATIRFARHLRRMSPDFETPIFYFKPYPGSEIVNESVASGYRLPENLAEWSEFDYVAGLPGPWVSPEKFELIERYKFFLDFAFQGAAESGWLQKLAKLRVERLDFRWPLEMHVLQRFRPAEKLS